MPCNHMLWEGSRPCRRCYPPPSSNPADISNPEFASNLENSSTMADTTTDMSDTDVASHINETDHTCDCTDCDEEHQINEEVVVQEPQWFPAKIEYLEGEIKEFPKPLYELLKHYCTENETTELECAAFRWKDTGKGASSIFTSDTKLATWKIGGTQKTRKLGRFAYNNTRQLMVVHDERFNGGEPAIIVIRKGIKKPADGSRNWIIWDHTRPFQYKEFIHRTLKDITPDTTPHRDCTDEEILLQEANVIANFNKAMAMARTRR